MGLTLFLHSIYSTGNITVPFPDSIDAPQNDGLRELLEQLATVEAGELQAGIPSLNYEAATWAVTRLFRAAQALVYRELPEAFITTEAIVAFPNSVDAAAVFSVDLSFRLLPDILRFSKGLSTDDPLTLVLMRLACNWPLSSVGVPGVQVGDIGMIAETPSLASLYVDRILRSGDVSRLSDPRIAAMAGQAIGDCIDLSPVIAAYFKERTARV